MSLVGTAQQGDRLATLTMIRDRLAADIDDCEDLRLLPALVLRLTDVLEQIDNMPTSHSVSAADEIADRRAARGRARAKDSSRSAAHQG